MKKIITISREFGAAGGTIGKAVAERLGFEYYDKALIIRAARDAHLDVEKMVNLDEHPPLSFGFGQSLFDLYSAPVEERFYEAQKEVIKKIGEHGKCVIVGRNANSILSEYDNSLHVFIHANIYWRVARMKEEKMKDLTSDTIMEEMKKIDKARRKFCSYYTNKDYGQASSYDLSLSSSTLGIDKCIDIICSAAE
ncbi:MAG: cytidylate kinase-like family protein [Treponema sp.]|uniref:cytidylate kinase-like family protein n=1 Tax=Treponema sp. TaxID=166 RepID=UPI001B684CDA|nr:cytidylate kinase-like family protein [Treponema sp.]MBP5403255.1 cytidylate kinase-like family protein [Treponema sp.]MBR5932700.1 cytidylate kinase-like family protein [Treponema sp.]